jgi:hypothetical protein
MSRRPIIPTLKYGSAGKITVRGVGWAGRERAN